MTTQGATPKINPTVAKYGGMPSRRCVVSECRHTHVIAVHYADDADRLPSCPHPRDRYICADQGCQEPMKVGPTFEFDRLTAMAAAGEELVRGVAWWLDATPARSSVQERKDALRAVRQAIANFEEASRE